MKLLEASFTADEEPYEVSGPVARWQEAKVTKKERRWRNCETAWLVGNSSRSLVKGFQLRFLGTRVLEDGRTVLRLSSANTI